MPDGPPAGTPLSRRRFLREVLEVGGAVAAGALVLDLTGCSGSDTATRPGPSTTGGAATTRPASSPTSTSPSPSTSATAPARAPAVGAHDVLFGLDPAGHAATSEETVRQACASLDWSWLQRGDSVFVKLAANSPYPHPAVTSPAAVRAVVAELRDRGAGRVLVGDQAGVGYVRRVADGRRFGSTRDCLAANGLLDAITASGGEPFLFDEQDYHSGYFAARPPAGSHWARQLAIPEVIRHVDHVVYLPRISAHVIAGYTCGHKLAIGWLRDDSRNHVHNDAASFYEKFTEVNYVPELRERFRLALVFAEKLQLHSGPDTNGTVVAADPRIVLASADLASIDAVTTGLLVHLDAVTAPGPGVEPYRAVAANATNQGFVTNFVERVTGIPWGPAAAADYTPLVPTGFEQGVSGDRVLSRAWEIGGGRPRRIRVVHRGAPAADDLTAAIVAHGEGVLALA